MQSIILEATVSGDVEFGVFVHFVHLIYVTEDTLNNRNLNNFMKGVFITHWRVSRFTFQLVQLQ